MNKTKYDAVDLTGSDAEILKVLKHQRNDIDVLVDSTLSTKKKIEDTIAECENHLQELGCALPKMGDIKPEALELPAIRTWSEILTEAEKDVSTGVSLTHLLSMSEVREANRGLSMLQEEFDAERRLDGMDWAIAGVAGVLAALVDTFLVKMPGSPGLLGGKETRGGPLSNFIRGRIRQSLTPDQRQVLERKYLVPYDATNSDGLARKVSGLNPRSHRFQSLGHDPILGFLLGVYDILHGSITAIDTSGHLIYQNVKSGVSGMSVFQAIAWQFGHLRSDVSTPGGLPAPLMPLLQFIQLGSFGKRKRTIGELARFMNGRGYDFGHFLALSIPVLMIETLVRSCYYTKRRMEGYDFEGSLPMNLPGGTHQPKLQTMLFVAHLISTSVNAGRVFLTDNPLAINYTQWITMAKISFQQLNWVLFEKEAERLAFVQSRIDRDWDILNYRLSLWWEKD